MARGRGDARRRAAGSTGAVSRCRSCGRASSAPRLLLFANAFGAIATAYALTGSLAQHRTILLYAQIRGDVLHDPNLGYALALGMMVDHRRCPTSPISACARARERWLDEARPASAPGSRSSLGALYFLVPLIGDLRVLAAHAPRRLQLRRLPRRARRSATSRRPSSIRPCSRSSTIVVGVLLVVPTAYWVQLRLPRLRGGGRVHHAAAAGHPGDRARVRLPAHSTTARRSCR